jgi:hypothetical protein
MFEYSGPPPLFLEMGVSGLNHCANTFAKYLNSSLRFLPLFLGTSVFLSHAT